MAGGRKYEGFAPGQYAIEAYGVGGFRFGDGCGDVSGFVGDGDGYLGRLIGDGGGRLRLGRGPALLLVGQLDRFSCSSLPVESERPERRLRP